MGELTPADAVLIKAGGVRIGRPIGDRRHFGRPIDDCGHIRRTIGNRGRVGLGLLAGLGLACALIGLGALLLLRTDETPKTATNEAARRSPPAAATPLVAEATDADADARAHAAAATTRGVSRESFREAPDSQPAPPGFDLLSAAFDVLVLDEGDRPAAGVPVALNHLIRRGSQSGRATTDANGRARMASAFDARHGTARPDLGFPYASADPAPRPDAKGVTTLRLPATGFVRVHVEDSRGRTPEYGFDLTIDHAGAPAERAENLRGAPVIAYAGRQDDAGRNPAVGLGLRLKVVAHSRLRGTGSVVCDGPTSPGQTVDVRITLDPAPSTLAARLQLPDGSPAADVVVQLGRELEPGMPRTQRSLLAATGRTDVAGAVSFPMDEVRYDSAGALLAFRVRMPEGRFIARYRIGERPDDGRYDAGTLTLAAEAPLATGRVVDEDGRSPANAVVKAWCPPDKIDPVTGADDVAFADAQRAQITVECDATTGAFTVHGPRGPWPLELSALAPGYAREGRAKVEPGARDVVLKVSGGTGRFKGSVALGGIPAADLSVAVFDAGKTKDGARRELALEPSGAFESGELPPGLYDVGVRLGPYGSDAPLAALVEGVAVEARSVTYDPRLRDMGVGVRFRKVKLTVVNESSEPVAGVVGEVLGPDGRGPSSALVGSRALQGHPDPGVVVVVLTDERCDVRIAEGRMFGAEYRPLVVRGVDGDRRVVMKRRPVVRVVVAGGDALGVENAELRVLLQFPGGGDVAAASPFGDDEILRPPEPGEYEVVWLLSIKRTGHGSLTPLQTTDPPQRVTVVESQAEQRLSLTPSAAVLEAAKRRLAGQ